MIPTHFCGKPIKQVIVSSALDQEEWTQAELKKHGIIHVDVTLIDSGLTHSYEIAYVDRVKFEGELILEDDGRYAVGTVIFQDRSMLSGTIRMKVMPDTMREEWTREALERLWKDVVDQTQPYVTEEEADAYFDNLEREIDEEANPKDLIGQKKPTIALFPPSALIMGSESMKDGAIKYGAYNWREKKITASEYLSPAMRHLLAWWDGEEYTRDSKLHHLGAALACIAILIDAMTCDCLNDDRPPPGAAADLLEKLTRA